MAPCENKNRAVRTEAHSGTWSKLRDFAGCTAQGSSLGTLLFSMEAGPLKHDSLAPHGWPARTHPHFHPSKAIHSLCLIHSGKSFREFTPVLGPGRKRHNAALQPLRAVILREVWQLLGVPNTLSRAFQGQGYFSHSTKMSFAFPLPFSQPILYSHKFSPRPAQQRHGLCADQAFLFVYLFIFNFWRPCLTACGILLSQPGIKPASPVLEAWSLSHWTTREVPKHFI